MNKEKLRHNLEANTESFDKPSDDNYVYIVEKNALLQAMKIAQTHLKDIWSSTKDSSC